VGRLPQELTRGWGRPPIWKVSTPDHGLGIRATHNLGEEGKKGSVVGRGRYAKSEKTRAEALGSEEGLRKRGLSFDPRK
jgi:hypothetical protein